MNIYVASSWRNEIQPIVVKELRQDGHIVYDFKNPIKGNSGFAWSQIDPNWETWNYVEYKKALEHPIAQAGFKSDFQAMKDADIFVLVMPCGRSAHLELGWAIGMGKPSFILLEDDNEPELMNLLATDLCISIQELKIKIDEGHDLS